MPGLPQIFSILFRLLITPKAHALEIGQESMAVLCGVVPCGPMGGGVAGLNAYVASTVVVALEVAIAAVAVVALLITSVKMVMFAGDDSSKDSKMSYVYVIVGLTVTALAQWIVQAFAPDYVGDELVNRSIVESGIGNVITYIRLAIAIGMMANIVIQGFRILTSQGESDQMDKARKRIIGGFIGAAVILLANAVVVAVVPELSGGPTSAALEIAGIANYIVTILGFLALLGIIIAGALLMLSADESLKDKAKTIIKTCVIALMIVILSYAFVYAFILFEAA